MTVRIAVVQQEVVPGAVEVNRAKALRLAREALERKPDIILFPEEMLVGYVANLRDLAEPADGPTTRAFRDLLRGTETQILWGVTERDGDACYVGAALVGADGLRALYRKTHLWWRAEGLRHEPTHYQPGNKLVTFDVKGHKSGVMICYDGDFPEMTRSYAVLGCDLLFWLNNRGSRGPEEVRPLVDRSSIVIAASCCCGKNESGDVCRGGSNITNVDGTVVEIWDREGIICADVDASAVPAIRQANPWFVGRRPDLYL
jgi:predicted amidohydrolase